MRLPSPGVDDRRIRVTTATRAFIRDAERTVTVVGLSARTALFVTDTDAGLTGSTVTLFLPTVNGELEVMAGIEQVEAVPAGFAVSVVFIVIDHPTRTALNDLVTLLLAGDGGGTRANPRVIYDVAIFYGPTLSLYGRLEDLSVRGASLRIRERLTPDVRIQFAVPDYSTDAKLVLNARVVQQRLSKEGGYHTGVELVDVDATVRAQLARLLADLLSR
jgi:hypothetical protein